MLKKLVCSCFTVLVTVSGGCAVLDEESAGGAGGKADEINPVDDEDLGHLLVELPAMPGQPDPHPFGLLYRDVSTIVAGDPHRLVKGPGDFIVMNHLFNPEPRKTVTIIGGQTVTEKLAAFTARWDTSASGPLAVDFGPRPSLHAKPETADGVRADLPFNADGAETAPFVVLPGSYMFDLGVAVLGTHTETLADGQFTRLDLTPADQRATLRVHPPQRKYPHPPGALHCETPRRHFLVHRYQPQPELGYYAEPRADHVLANQTVSDAVGIYIREFKNFDLTQTTTFRMLPFVASEAPNHYEYVVNNQAMTLALMPGQTLDLYIKRIDVNDVRVTREDGSTYYVSGTWRVERETAPNVWRDVYLVGNSASANCANLEIGRRDFPTKSGLDVLPGKYRVTISYATAEGGRTQQHVLNLQ